ncbi:MAG: methyltransferase [Actinomycetota bacterium]|nr:methyltransferase [Actinomycetota bacterium]
MLAHLVGEDQRVPRSDVLDVCTGSGVIAISAARAGARSVHAVDLSRRAALAARLNARLNRVQIQAVRGSLFDAVPGRTFDVIASNPPYLPAETDELPGRGARRAWEAGRNGRVLLDQIIARAPRHLSPGGVLWLVHSSVCGVDETLAGLEAAGLDPVIAQSRRGPLGPLLAGRADELEARRVLARGQREEDVVAIRATLPTVAGAPTPAPARRAPG